MFTALYMCLYNSCFNILVSSHGDIKEAWILNVPINICINSSKSNYYNSESHLIIFFFDLQAFE